jgi:hypothetical protein
MNLSGWLEWEKLSKNWRLLGKVYFNAITLNVVYGLKAKEMRALCILQNSKQYTLKVDTCECCGEKNGKIATL